MTGNIEKLLTQRERDVLKLLMQGKNNRDIAKHLLITHHTVKAHISSILKKTGAKNRVQAIIRCFGN
jgi:two-component system response regulator DegU